MSYHIKPCTLGVHRTWFENTNDEQSPVVTAHIRFSVWQEVGTNLAHRILKYLLIFGLSEIKFLNHELFGSHGGQWTIHS